MIKKSTSTTIFKLVTVILKLQWTVFLCDFVAIMVYYSQISQFSQWRYDFSSYTLKPESKLTWLVFDVFKEILYVCLTLSQVRKVCWYFICIICSYHSPTHKLQFRQNMWLVLCYTETGLHSGEVGLACIYHKSWNRSSRFYYYTLQLRQIGLSQLNPRLID